MNELLIILKEEKGGYEFIILKKRTDKQYLYVNV